MMFSFIIVVSDVIRRCNQCSIGSVFIVFVFVLLFCDMFEIFIYVFEGYFDWFDKMFVVFVLEEVVLLCLCFVKLIVEGVVFGLCGIVIDGKFCVELGEYVIDIGEFVLLDVQFEVIVLNVVYEDDDLIVIDKFVGMVVYFVFGVFLGMLVNVLLYYCVDSLLGIGGVVCLGIVYWIDKEILGLLVVVKIDCVYQGLVV